MTSLPTLLHAHLTKVKRGVSFLFQGFDIKIKGRVTEPFILLVKLMHKSNGLEGILKAGSL